jgi:hypothetical protein
VRWQGFGSSPQRWREGVPSGKINLVFIKRARRRQAGCVVIVAQNTVEWRHVVRKRRLGFSLVFAKIPHDSSPIYRGFACRSRATRIRLRRYLQSKFEPSFGWDLVDFRLGKEKSYSAKSSRGRRVRHRLVLATGPHWAMGSGCQGE